MSINFSAWAIRNPVPSLMLFLMLTLIGFFGFKHLPIQEFPDIELPAVTVNVSLPGATPSQLETEVTRKVEDAVASLGNVEHVTSTVTDGVSITSVEFSLEKDTQEALDEVRDAVTRIRSQMPTDIREPLISKITTGGQAVLTYAVEGSELTEEGLSWFIDNTVSKHLLAVPDVASVTRQGGVSREVQIRLDVTKLKAYGLTAGQVSQQLRLVQQEASGGSLEIGGQNQSVRAAAAAENVRELASLHIPLGDGRAVRLSDIADVSDTHAPESQVAFVGDKEVVSFQVFRSRGASDVAVAEAVRKAVSEIEARTPGLRISEVSNSVDRITKSYEGSMHSLYEGAVLAILVVWLFLRDWRATLVSAVALPLSVIPTFFFMHYAFGFSLNTITLLALTLVVGILVDDAIVEVENILRHLKMGKPPLQAAMEAASEIGLAVIATTMTLVAVFLPTAFMGGIPGKFFVQFGWTAAVAVLISLLVARLLTPMLAAHILKPHATERTPGKTLPVYLAGVRWCLAHPWLTLGLAGAFFIGSIWLISRIPTEFMPASDNGKITISVELPPGSALADTAETAALVRKALTGLAEVQSVYTSIGTGSSSTGGPRSTGPGAGQVNKGTLLLNLTAERERSQKEVELDVRRRLEQIPGAKFSLGMGASGEKYTMTLAGDDSEQLDTAADMVETALRGVAGLGNVSSSASSLKPEVVLRPYADRAAEAGVTTQTLSQAVRVASSGDYDTALAKLNLPERQIPIRVWAEDALRTDVEALKQLRIPVRGGAVELASVSEVELSSGPSQINRRDRQRNVTVSVELNGAKLGEVSKTILALPVFETLPIGVKILPSGDMERMKELFGSFGLAMAAGIVCVYVVLVLLFHSFGQPLTIMAALPLSAGGAFGLLALFGYSMSMPALIGLLLLMGIVTKNSILLVEYAVVAQRDRGLARQEALLDACSKRAQPIVMTTIAMVAGMLPLALGMNGEAAFRSPMATAVIGGLLTSTLLSLLVVPVVYEVVDEAKSRMGALISRASKRPAADSAAAVS